MEPRHSLFLLSAGGYSVQPDDPKAVSKSTQKLIYGMLFPVAFIAIIWTGAELFTGNTMTMLVCILERRIKVYHLVLNWLSSLFGNWLGALFVAYFLSYLTGSLDDTNVQYFLFSAAKDKTAYSFGSCFLRAVGCNAFVCLAVWFVIATDDGAGKIMALWFPILAFCVGGYEHIIANFYTLQAALIAGAPVSLGNVIVKNFIPTLLGNLVGGCCLIGAVYWYNFYPTVTVREHLLHGSGTFQVQPLVGDLEANNNPFLGGSGSEVGASQEPQAGSPPQSQGQSIKRGSVLASKGGCSLGGPLDTSTTMVLPKESFGGHYVVGRPSAGPPKTGKGTTQFSVVPGWLRGNSSRVSQGKSATDICDDGQQNNNNQGVEEAGSKMQENLNV